MHLWVIALLREVDAVTGVVIGSLVKVTGFIAEPFPFVRTWPIGDNYNEKQKSVPVSECRRSSRLLLR
jgi:hypothetical protein